MIAPYATDIREADFIHCTIFENYSRFAGALQVPPSTTTRLLNSLLHGNESPCAATLIQPELNTNGMIATAQAI
jgi:hypothetical protein